MLRSVMPRDSSTSLGMTDTYMTTVSTNLEDLSWIPRPRLLALRRLGIETTEDLLTHFPRRHEDRTEFPQFPREETDVPICLCGEVIKTSLRRFGGWKKIFEATLEESQPNALSEPLVCRWFNLHYVQKMIATGQRIVVFGKPRLRGKRICMDHPEFEVIENDEEISIHFRRITPIYPATEGLSQRVLRGIVYRVLHEVSRRGMGTDRPDHFGARRAIGRDSRDTFSRKLGSAGRRARASRALGIFCHANADCVAAFRTHPPEAARHTAGRARCWTNF